MKHRTVIVGGGTAGISVAARLRRAGETDVCLIDPAADHYYQPLWTLVGGGCAPAEESRRSQADVMPQGVHWIQDAVTEVDPDTQEVVTASGVHVGYDYLVMCPGIQLDWDRIPGLEDTLGQEGVSSNYDYELAPKTWQFLRALDGGTAVFTMPSGPIKCAGAPQKIAYLAADWYRQQGRDNRVVMVLPTPGMFGVPVFARELEKVVADYGIEVRFQSELTEVDSSTKTAHFVDRSGDEESTFDLDYDVMHVVPPQSAPDWVKQSPLSDGTANGYVDIDKHTMRHTQWPNVFALGDAGNSPNSKTGAAIRKQAPVVVENLLATMHGEPADASYGGYASCPLTTARNRMLLAEFDYSMEWTPTFKGIDTSKPRYDMWLLKRRGLPMMYWNALLKGLA
jgi:sulfide:quinone oxidoreductase